MNLEESLRSSSKVFQGQENSNLRSPHQRSDEVNHLLSSDNLYKPNQRMPSSKSPESLNIQSAAGYTSFGKSDMFPTVLQGQEVCPYSAWRKPSVGCSLFSTQQRPKPSFYPVASAGSRSLYFPPHSGIHKESQGPAMSYQTGFTGGSGSFSHLPVNNHMLVDEALQYVPASGKKQPEDTSVSRSLELGTKDDRNDTSPVTQSGCRLFGISLTAETTTQNASKRSCTKAS